MREVTDLLFPNGGRHLTLVRTLLMAVTVILERSRVELLAAGCQKVLVCSVLIHRTNSFVSHCGWMGLGSAKVYESCGTWK